MVHVNRNQLSQKDAQLLLQRFDTTLIKLDPKTTTIFLNELLGKEERLTIAKRLATIILIHEGCSEFRVSRLLKLSHSTTGIIAERLRAGSYDGIIRSLKRKKLDYIELLNTIDSILHLNGLLPHRVGLDRYRNTYSQGKH